MKKICDSDSYEFILDNPVKITDVVKGNHLNGELIVRVFREDGNDKPIFRIEKKEEKDDERSS